MAIKKIKKIPTSITKGSGKNKKTYIHYISLKDKTYAENTIKQVVGQFKEVIIEHQSLKGEDIFSLYIIKNN